MKRWHIEQIFSFNNSIGSQLTLPEQRKLTRLGMYRVSFAKESVILRYMRKFFTFLINVL